MRNLDEIELWEKIRRGDMDSLGELYEIYIDTLFSYGKKFSNDKEIIEDSIHDLFVELYKYKNKLSPTDNVQYYLFRSLKNIITNKSLKIEIISITNENWDSATYNKNVSETIEESLISIESKEEQNYKLTSAKSLLTKKQALVLSLKFEENKTYEEIAKLMNVSIETIRTTIYRAIKVLKSQLTIILIFLTKLFF